MSEVASPAAPAAPSSTPSSQGSAAPSSPAKQLSSTELRSRLYNGTQSTTPAESQPAETAPAPVPAASAPVETVPPAETLTTGDPQETAWSGPTFEEFQTYWSDTNLPEGFLKKFVTVNPDGIEDLVTVEDCIQGYMMQNNFSKKTQEIASIKKNYESELSGINRFVGELKKGETFMQGIDNIANRHPEILDAFEHAVQQRADADLALWNECEGNGKLYAYHKQQEKLQRENNRLKGAEERRLKQEAAIREAQKLKDDPTTKNLKKQLDQLVPAAFTEIGQEPNAFAVELLYGHLPSFWPEGEPLTAQMVRQAARAVKQELASKYRAATEEKPKKPAGPPQGAPKGTSGKAPPQGGKTAEELRRMVRRRAG